MTIKEALTTKTKPLALDAGALELAILEAGLDGTADYDPTTGGQDVDMVWAGLLFTTIRNKRISEDDVTIEGPEIAALKLAYSAIMLKWGLEDPFAAAKPMVRQRNFW